MSLRYPTYKPSGVEWLGDVPETWSVSRLRALGRFLKGSGGSKDDIVEIGVPCVRYGDLYTTHGLFIEQARTCVDEPTALDYTEILRGDVLFAASGEKLEEIGKSAVNLIQSRAVCGGDLVILRPITDAHDRWLAYVCDSPFAILQKASMGRGTTVKHIYPDELRTLTVFVPSLPEQRSIAAFLDRETSKIDALVSEQERLIALLKEKRQAVISHAVTKGLNPHVKMKPSGVEWLGDVPEHWEVDALRRTLSMRSGDAITSSDIHEQGSIPVFGANGVRGFTEAYTHTGTHALIGRQGALCGNVCVARGTFWASEHAVVVSSRVEVSVEWLASMLQSMNLNQHSTSAAQPGLSVESIIALKSVFPPAAEQRSIAAFLDMETSKIDTLCTEAERAIDLLKERRSALISAAVTGQIDVRGAVPA